MRQFRKLTVPEKAHPLVRRLFKEMNYQRIGMRDLADRTGVNVNTIKDWKDRSVPHVHNLVACLNAVGVDLRAVRRKEED